MRRIGLTLAALLTASGLAACGSSSSGGDSDTTQPAATADSADFDRAAAQQTAQAALLTLDDFPTGWKESPSDSSEADDAAFERGLADCLGVSALIFSDEGPDRVHVESSEFEPSSTDGSGTVNETVDVETAQRLAQDFEVINSDKLTGCLEDMYGEFLQKKFAEDPQTKDATVGDVTAARTDIPSYGEESAGISIKMPFSIQGTDAEIDIDMVFIRVGNAAAQLQFQNTFEPFDTATAATITAKAADKLSQAAA